MLEELSECLPGREGDPVRAAEDRELAEVLSDFLRQLPERDRYLFLRRYWHAQPLEEIADACRLPAGTVKASLFRTRKKLRRRLEKEGILL